MSVKTCFITGGNAGIGKAAALQLAEKGYRVAIGCRNKVRGEAALADLRRASPVDLGELVVVDMASRDSVMAAAAEVGRLFDGSLDALIHNAAEFDISRKAPTLSPDGVETVWATNHVNPVLLTEALAGPLEAGPRGRIVTVASQGLMMHPGLEVDTKDPEFRNRRFSVAKAYYQSKLAQLMYTYYLSRSLAGTGVTANCVRVANVKVDLTRYPGLSSSARIAYAIKSRFSISAAEMAGVYAWLADDPSLDGVSGRYVNEKKKIVSSSPYSRDDYEINRVMKLTRRYVDGKETS